MKGKDSIKYNNFLDAFHAARLKQQDKKRSRTLDASATPSHLKTSKIGPDSTDKDNGDG